eukprot:Platyproteum_vivax@DN7310_c0_g1_i1.p2
MGAQYSFFGGTAYDTEPSCESESQNGDKVGVQTRGVRKRQADPRWVTQPDDKRAAKNKLSLNMGPESEVLVEKFNIPITRGCLGCLKEGEWLNDEVINFYMMMIQEYNDLRRDENLHPRC